MQIFRKISLNRQKKGFGEFVSGIWRRFRRAAGKIPVRVSVLAAGLPGAVNALAALLKSRLHAFREMEQEQRSQILRWTVSCVLMVTVTAGSVATVMASARWADITVDGEKKPRVEIASDSTAEILSLAGVTPASGDLVTRTQSDAGAVQIVVRTARCAVVSADGGRTSVRLHYGDTVRDALSKAGVAVDTDDGVTPSEGTPVAANMNIGVLRRRNITITADGATTSIRVNEGTVSQALAQAGVTVGPEDTTSVQADADVADGMNIRVARVSYRNVTAAQAIPYKTVVRKDSSLTAGVKKQQTAGKNGVKTIVSRQKLCDGSPVESTVVSSAVTAQPVDQVVLLGTKSYVQGAAHVGGAGTFVDRAGRTVSYRRLLTGRCTAYTGGGTTSTGRAAAYGLVAVNPDIIPYGTRLYITSPGGGVVYGYAVAADTGGAAMHNRILADLYYDTYAGCEQIGSRTMNVYVLD